MSVSRRGKKGVFYMQFTVNGQRIYRSTGKFTKREAKQVEAAEKQKLLRNPELTPQEKGAQTLLLDAIEEVYQIRWRQTKDSQRSYRRALNLADLIGNMELGKITEEVITHLTRTLESNGSKPATINRYLACLKTILKHKKQDTEWIRLRKERKGRIRVISQEEESQIVRLLKSAPQGNRRSYYPEVADLIEILLDTGMRLGEALNLQYPDIDLESGLISIWINKGDRPRSVPMTRRVRSILEQRQQVHHLKPFTIKSHQAETAWKWVRKEMGLEGEKEFVLHSTRHTCASRMVNAGVDLYVVKEILGHASIQITERYAHLSPHKLAHAVEVLEK